MRSEIMNKVKVGVKPKRNVRGIKFFTVKDLAEILDLSITSARLYLKEGKIKGAIKIGGSWYISNKNLDRWLSQSYLFNKSEAEIIEDKVIGNIEISLE
ncbi:DNA-binding protein, partial [Candidatus Atribacteria bacterium 1244-E10-H5-B2]